MSEAGSLEESQIASEKISSSKGAENPYLSPQQLEEVCRLEDERVRISQKINDLREELEGKEERRVELITEIERSIKSDSSEDEELLRREMEKQKQRLKSEASMERVEGIEGEELGQTERERAVNILEALERGDEKPLIERTLWFLQKIEATLLKRPSIENSRGIEEHSRNLEEYFNRLLEIRRAVNTASRRLSLDNKKEREGKPSE